MKTKIFKAADDYYYIIAKRNFFTPWRILMRRFDEPVEHLEGYIFHCWVKGQANAIAKKISKGDFGDSYYLGRIVMLKHIKNGC